MKNELKKMELDEELNIVLTYEDDSDGDFMLGGTFCPKRTCVTIPKSKFNKLKDLMKCKTKR